MELFAQTQQKSRLGQILLDKRLVSQEQLSKAMEQQATTGERLGDILTQWNVVTQRHIESALRAQRALRLVAYIATATMTPLITACGGGGGGSASPTAQSSAAQSAAASAQSAPIGIAAATPSSTATTAPVVAPSSTTAEVATPRTANFIQGDFASEPRSAGHVDVDKLVAKLVEAKANTYMWLIWHSQSDWLDLETFLPKANAAGIKVWVYLVPQSETPAGSAIFKNYSEPYRLDYVRWASEIAQLSLRHSNLVGYVIDDFVANMIPTRFNDNYIADFTNAGKAINPNIKFYPLIYFDEITHNVISRIRPMVDGIVAAYPPSRKAIQDVQPILRGTYSLPPSARILTAYPVADNIGSAGISGVFKVLSGITKIGFTASDSYNYFIKEKRYLQLKIDDEVAWQEDIAGYDNQNVELDISRYTAGKSSVKVEFAVANQSLGFAESFSARFFINHVIGMQSTTTPDITAKWKTRYDGYNVVYESAVNYNSEKQLPMILMPAGEGAEYAKRYGVAATPELIGDIARMSRNMALDGYAEGLVMYCLPKDSSNEIFNQIKLVYSQ